MTDKATHELQSRLRQEVNAVNSIRVVARKYGVSHGMLHRAMKGIMPKNNESRKALGLPLLGIGYVCEKCGVVHSTQCQ